MRTEADSGDTIWNRQGANGQDNLEGASEINARKEQKKQAIWRTCQAQDEEDIIRVASPRKLSNAMVVLDDTNNRILAIARIEHSQKKQ